MLNLIDLRNRSITIKNRVESDKWKDLKDLTRILEWRFQVAFIVSHRNLLFKLISNIVNSLKENVTRMTDRLAKATGLLDAD